MRTIEKKDSRAIVLFCFGVAAFFLLAVFVWPALNVVVAEMVGEAGSGDFGDKYSFFFKLSWPYSGIVAMMVAVIWGIFVLPDGG